MAAASQPQIRGKSRHVALVRSRCYLLSCLASAFGRLAVSTEVPGTTPCVMNCDETRDSSHVAQFLLLILSN